MLSNKAWSVACTFCFPKHTDLAEKCDILTKNIQLVKISLSLSVYHCLTLAAAFNPNERNEVLRFEETKIIRVINIILLIETMGNKMKPVLSINMLPNISTLLQPTHVLYSVSALDSLFWDFKYQGIDRSLITFSDCGLENLCKYVFLYIFYAFNYTVFIIMLTELYCGSVIKIVNIPLAISNVWYWLLRATVLCPFANLSVFLNQICQYERYQISMITVGFVCTWNHQEQWQWLNKMK